MKQGRSIHLRRCLLRHLTNMSGLPRPPRDVLAVIWKNFRDSLTVMKRPRGNLVGKDYLGTSYYELPAEPQRGKRRPSRWFETNTENKEKFDQEIPVEWEAWLRGRRDNPPSETEVNSGLAMSQSKKIKADELNLKADAARRTSGDPDAAKKAEYPKYDEYEITPGKPAAKK